MGDNAEFWDKTSFGALWSSGSLPCNFSYDGREAEKILPHWEKEVHTTQQSGYMETIIKFTDPQTHLTCTIELRTYSEFPAFDWVLKFVNKGNQPTPILEDIFPLAGIWQTHFQGPTQIFYSKGSDCKIDDFLPQSQTLKHWETLTLKGFEGRPSVRVLPFVRIQNGNQSCLIAIGWTGQWMLRFILNQERNVADGMVMIEGGMEKTHLRLLPGEEIRTPRVVLCFGDAEKYKLNNIFRRFLLAHYSPSINGHFLHAPLAFPTWGGLSIKEHLEWVQTIQRHHLQYEYYWVDAGWFIDESESKTLESSGTWAKWAGRWRHNTRLYPDGLKPLSDAIHEAGMKFLLWVEPERAQRHTETPLQHPDFYLQRKPPTSDLCFNLGNPKARKWLTDFLSDLIRNYGIDCYRQDFNFDPLPYWQAADAPDRQGITEIYHVMGLYEMWDALLQRFPGLLIDNCASGGRRIDIETIRRSIPLWRSDFQCANGFDPTGSQIHTYGLMSWVPLSATGTGASPGDTYNVRSAYSTGLDFHVFSEWMEYDEKTYPWDWHVKMMNEYIRVRPYLESDFYPLGSVSESPVDWVVYQCHSPEKDAGIVVAFRRPESPFVQAQYRLWGLTINTKYRFVNADTAEATEFTSSILSQKGLLITLLETRSSAIFFYEAIAPKSKSKK